MMRSALLGFIGGVLSLGYVPWLMPWLGGLGIAAFMMVLLFQLLLHRYRLAIRYPLLSWVSAVGLFSAAFLISVVYSQYFLRQAIAQRPLQAQQLTTSVYVPYLSDGVGGDWQQTVRVAGPGPLSGQRLILYTAYQSWTEGTKQPPPAMLPGQFWQVTLKIKPAHSKASFYAFDVEKWLLSEHITATATLVDAKVLDATALKQLKLRQTVLMQLQAAIQRERLAVRMHVSQLNMPGKGVLLGLLTGDRSLIDQQTTDLYRQMGISHLLAISGPHVVLAALMLVWLCSKLLNRFPRLYLVAERRRWLIPLFLLVVFAYACLAGFDLPAQRTVLMLTLSTSLLWWHKQLDNLLILLIAATVLLLIDPLAVLSAAFWLSFGAVAILLSMSRETPKQEADAASEAKKKWLLQVMSDVQWFIRLQWRLFLVLTPLVLWCFGQVSLLSPIVNILAIPFLSFCVLPLNILAYASYQLSPTVADWLWRFTAGLLDYFHQLLNWLALQFPAALQPFYLHWTAAVALALVVTILLLPRGVLPRWWIAFLLVPVICPYRPQAMLAVHVLDVGQGLSVLVQTETHSMLIDAGGKSPHQLQGMGAQVALPALRGLDVRQLDQLLLTHQDKDHVGGAPEVLAGLSVRHILSSRQPEFSTGKVPLSLCQAGQHWVWDKVKFSILSPSPLWTDLDENDASCVLMIEIPAHARQPAKRVLIMGDAGFYPEYLLQQQYAHLKADILVLGHHGSKNSSSSPFLAAVKPKRAVVSAGFLNAYQHPSPVVLARLKEQGVVIDSTVTGGTLSYHLNPADTHLAPLRYRDSLLWLKRVNDADGGLLRRQQEQD